MNLFTSEELYVIASLLGKEFIIGVEGETLNDNLSDLNSLFDRNFTGLESKGVFEYRIDGTLLIDCEVYDVINVLNKADDIFVVATDHAGKKEKVDYLRYGDLYCKLVDQGKSYLTEVIDGFSYKSIIDSYGISLPDSPIKNVSFLLNDLKKMDDLYNSFNVEEANEYLSNLLSDNAMEELVRECFIKKSNAFILKEYRRIGCRLVNVDKLILRFVKDYILKFYISGVDTVTVSVYRKENA